MVSINKSALTKMGNTEWTNNWTAGGLEHYCEIRNDQTGEVWLCQQPISHKEFQSLQLPNEFSRVGIGRSAHDAAYFRRSPDATEDSPVEIMKVGDRFFSKVARPGALEQKYMKQGYRNFILLPVYKYHKVMFKAGRTIEILTMEDGKDYVPNATELNVILGNQPVKKRILPEDWSIRKITLEEGLILEIPCPARVCFFKSGYGFHGPVEIF